MSVNCLEILHRDGRHAWRFCDHPRCNFRNQREFLIKGAAFLEQNQEKFLLQGGDRVFLTDPATSTQLVARIKNVFLRGLGMEPMIHAIVDQREKCFSILTVDQKLPDDVISYPQEEGEHIHHWWEFDRPRVNPNVEDSYPITEIRYISKTDPQRLENGELLYLQNVEFCLHPGDRVELCISEKPLQCINVKIDQIYCKKNYAPFVAVSFDGVSLGYSVRHIIRPNSKSEETDAAADQSSCKCMNAALRNSD